MKKFFTVLFLVFACFSFVGCQSMQGLPNGDKNDVHTRMQEMHMSIDESSQMLYIDEPAGVSRNPNSSVFARPALWQRKSAFVETAQSD